MNEDRNQGRQPKPQARQQHPDESQRDLNPEQMAGQNIGPEEPGGGEGMTAFHLRKRGTLSADLGRERISDSDLKRVPLLPEGTRLQQGATYTNLTDEERREFTGSGDMTARPGEAIAPKDRVPYEIWNRLIGEPKPGQE